MNRISREVTQTQGRQWNSGGTSRKGRGEMKYIMYKEMVKEKGLKIVQESHR